MVQMGPADKHLICKRPAVNTDLLLDRLDTITLKLVVFIFTNLQSEVISNKTV